MKTKILRIGAFVLIMGLVVHFAGGLNLAQTSPTAFALGDLTIDWGVPPGDPIFVVTNMLPGDVEERNVKITNGGTVARFISVKGTRTGGVGVDPKLETILDFIISTNGTDLYGGTSGTGPKSVENFFTDSSGPNGIPLAILTPSQLKTFTFKASFPTSAGNEFQNKSVIFDITLGIITGDNIVINEVYYIVDGSHGLDSPKDRGISVHGNVVTIIQNNGAGSTNTITVNINQACNILQQNNTNVNVNVNASSNTGGNSASGNTGGVVSIVSGAASAIANIVIQGGNNSSSECGKKLGQNDEWVELFNPTDQDISLKNWTITDNSGNPTIIHPNKIIKAGGFALLSKSASVWQHWNENPSATKVELGNQMGDGLDNGGDHLVLKNPQNHEVDRMSWGSDTSGFTPPGTNPLVTVGNSTERLAPGFDTNNVSDWEEQNPPTPGN